MLSEDNSDAGSSKKQGPTNGKVQPALNSNDMMPAAFITRYGKDALQVGEQIRPSVASLPNGYVLLRVHAVCIQPADVKTRRGALRVMKGKPTPSHPCILGYDCAGTIEAVGPNMKRQWQVGDQVMCVATAGGLATYTTVHESFLARKPGNVSFAHAASFVTSSLTVMQAFQYAKEYSTSGLKKILITAGAGGVGHVAIQVAKKVLKADLVATTASSAKHEFVKECGADIVVDYRKPGAEGNFVQALAKCGPFDMALDCTGETKKCKKITATGGVVVGILGLPDGSMMKRVVELYDLDRPPSCFYGILDLITRISSIGSKVSVKNMITLPFGEELEKYSQMLADGTIKITLDRIFPLAQAPEAFDYVEKGHVTGRVVVECLEGDSQGVPVLNN